MTSAENTPHGPSVVAPGNYDGVHAGHRALIQAARELAGDGVGVTVMTFNPHPAVLLAPERAPALLTTIERRIELLRGAGADRVEVATFDEAFAAQSPDEFVEDLVGRLGARGVVVGPDFRFGKGRAGDIEVLRSAGASMGFAVRVVDPVLRGGEVVSSTRIRRCLREGRVEDATELLGRVHDSSGVVVEGDRRGRTIGFPTANLACDPVLLPADGVYAVVGRAPGGELLTGVANLGVRPTFAAGRSVEVHLFDFDGDLYGRTLRVGFVGRLRGEQKFDGLDALKAQIASDAERARRLLAAADREAWRWI